MSHTLDRVKQDLENREMKGLATYGVTVDRDDYDHLDWLIEAYNETLDNAMYLRRAIDTLRAKIKNEKRTNL